MAVNDADSFVKRGFLLSKQKSGIWQFFSSVKLALALLACIAGVSIIGTLVPQQEGAREMMQHMSPGLVSFLRTMQVFDLYHSLWFFLLMGLLSLNLIVCSLNRFPAAWRRIRADFSPEDESAFKGTLSDALIIRTKMERTAVADTVQGAMKGKWRRLQRRDTDRGSFLCAEKGRWSYLGVYIVHVSVLLLVAGAVIGSLFGIEGFVNISEGETVKAIDLRGGRGTQNLPFAVRCDRFTIEFYENGAPKTFRSDLTFLKADRIIHQGPLLVNHPISIEGIRFYQASYGRAPEGKASLSLLKNGRKEGDKSLAAGDSFELPGREGTVHVMRIEDNLMQMGPAMKLSIHSSRGETAFWVFRHIDKIREANPGLEQQVPLFNPGLFKPYVFVLNGMAEKYYTGLQVGSDPGVPLVVAAAFCMIIGLMMVFFMSHRQIWIRIEGGQGQSRITLAGRSHRDAPGLERDMKRLLEEIGKRVGAMA